MHVRVGREGRERERNGNIGRSERREVCAILRGRVQSVKL